MNDIILIKKEELEIIRAEFASSAPFVYTSPTELPTINLTKIIDSLRGRHNLSLKSVVSSEPKQHFSSLWTLIYNQALDDVLNAVREAK